jgi:hypothetical protein
VSGVRSRRAASWPFPAAAGVLLAILAAYLWGALRQNAGHFVFAQDDPYIHLSIARTLATTGVWGLTADHFAPASSSPLWTVLLAGLARFGGASAMWPLGINVAAGVLVLWVFDRLLRLHAPPAPRFGALVAAIVVLPLPTLVFIGMEHTLHVAVVLAFCGAAAQKLAREDDERDGLWIPGLMLAVVTSGLRYEGLFVVAAVAVGFALVRHWITAFSVGVAGAIGPVAYAIFAVAHGALPVPNSVLMKSDPARFASASSVLALAGDWVGLLSLHRRPVFAALTTGTLLLAAVIATPRMRGRTPATVLGALFLGVEVLHVCLVKVEWFYRYEAYVVGLGLAAVSLAACEAAATTSWRDTVSASPMRRRAIAACVVVLALPLVSRAAEAMLLTVPATGEVYKQQYQMGVFFRDHYAGDVIALNDIGAVSWLAPVEIVDLIGLASSDVADARRRNADDTALYARVLQRHHAVAACVYEYYFSGSRALPESWRRVGEWDMGRHAAVSGERVAFYAPPGHEARLARALDDFAPRLPTGVEYHPQQR